MKFSVLPLPALVLLAGGFLFSSGCSSTGTHVLATIENDTLDVPEYTRYCERLHGSVPDSLPQRVDLLTRLVNFKAKVHEARREGLDKDSALVAEVHDFADQLSVSFLLEDQIVNPGIRELYAMRREELRASHILVRFHRDFRGAIDTVSTRNEAEKLLREIHGSTELFDTLVARHSEDGLRSVNHGDLGWFVPGTTLPDMDRMLFAMKVGTIAPHLVRSPFGYHIFKLTGRRPLRQRVEAGHILYRLDVKTPDDTSAGYAHLTLILDSLRRGLATFADLARRNSMDAVSGAQGGSMGWVERGTDLDPRFEAVLSTLKPGEVSGIVRTQYGLHILKLMQELEPRTFEEQKADLRKLYRKFAYQQDYLRYIESLRNASAFVISHDVVARIVGLMDTAMTTSTPRWDARIDPRLREAYLFRLASGPFTVREAIVAIRQDPNLQMRKFTQASVDSMAIYLADKRILHAKAEAVRDTSAAFRLLADDYRLGALVTRVEQKNVLDKSMPGSADIENYWREHRADFRWPDRVRFSEIYVYDRHRADLLHDSLVAGADFAALAQRHTRRAEYFTRGGDWGWLPVTTNEYTRMAADMNLDSLSGVIPMDVGFSIMIVRGKDKAREKTFEEARPEVAALVREALIQRNMDAWTDALRARFHVRQFNEHLSDMRGTDRQER